MRKLNIISSKVLTLWHGTSDTNAEKIKKKGLHSPVESAQWYMLASHKDDAIFHSEKANGKPVIVKFEVPYEEGKGWKGWPYLWPPYKASGGFKGEWYALKQDLPSSFMKEIIKVSENELRRVKG